MIIMLLLLVVIVIIQLLLLAVVPEGLVREHQRISIVPVGVGGAARAIRE